MNGATVKIRRLAGAAGLISLVACSGGDPLPTPTPDGGPVAPTPDTIGDPQTLIVERLTERTPYWSTAVRDDLVLAAFDDGVVAIATGTVTDVASAAGTIVGAGRWQGGVLVAASDGFYVLEGDALVRSPLSDALSGLSPSALMSVPRAGAWDLWIAGAGGLARWADGEVQTLTPGGLPTTGCVMDHGAPLGGASAVWLACEGTLYALVGAGSNWQAHEQTDVSDVRSLAVDGAKTLWIVGGDGSVWSRTADGAWRAHDFATDARSVSAVSDGELWIDTMTGLWRHDQGVFHRIQDPTGMSLIGAAGTGRALLKGSQGLLRVHTALRVELVGLNEGELVEDLAEVRIVPLIPEMVQAVSATVDGASVLVVEDAGWSVAIDPEVLQDGSHELWVNAAYVGGEEATASLRFSRYAGPPPTWTDDVSPLFDDSCALCHGAQGSARRLDTQMLWREQIDLILENVRTGRMPLPPNPPLTPAEVEQIEGWAAAGFPGGE